MMSPSLPMNTSSFSERKISLALPRVLAKPKNLRHIIGGEDVFGGTGVRALVLGGVLNTGISILKMFLPVPLYSAPSLSAKRSLLSVGSNVLRLLAFLVALDSLLSP